jgi:hypothetical protein
MNGKPSTLLLLLMLVGITACCATPEPQPVAVPQRKVVISPELLQPAKREALKELEALLTESTAPLPLF